MTQTGFKVVCRFDPAIDAEAMSQDDVRRFRDTGDVALLRYLEGEQPTVFYCRRLRVSEMQSVKATNSEADTFVASFQRGLLSVENLLDDDGNARKWSRPDADRPISMREVEAAFSAGEVMEVGAAIYGRSILGKGRPAAWPQPDTSALAVAALAHQRAAQKRAAAAHSAPSSESPKAPPGETSAG